MATEAQKLMRARIRQLEAEQDRQRDELKVMAKEVVGEFQSGRFIRNSIHGLLSDKTLQKDVLGTITPIITSLISGTIMQKTKHTKVRLLTVLGQLGINGITSTYGSVIQKYLRAYVKVGKDLLSKK